MSSTINVRESHLTAQELLNYYSEAYQKLHHDAPRCETLGNHHFVIDGSVRDWHWLALEIELLHQRLLTSMNSDSAEYIAIRKMVRRFQAVINETL